MNNKFGAMGIQEAVTELLKQNGVVVPTPVQEKAIPLILKGQDVIAQAQTGTGKTLAFVLPILEKLDVGANYTQALIISPTRELAIQITAEFKKLVPAVGASVIAVYGGQDVQAQIHKLKGAAQIVVATPGRLLDHLQRGTIALHGVRMLVLDEADQMLAMGFYQEVEAIIRHTSRERQTLLFSATMPDTVRKLALETMKQPQDIRIRQGKQITLEGIKQLAVETTDRTRQHDLITLIEQQRPFLAMVFCRTKIRAKKLTEALVLHGMNVDELHGDLSQAKRETVMKRFREAKLQILVATDVAARGLDVEGVTHVFNYDLPLDAESYIHRIGRTGRAGNRGLAITLVASKDRILLDKIEKGIGMPIPIKQSESAREEKALKSAAREAKGRASKPARGASRGAASKPGRGSSRDAGSKPGRGSSRDALAKPSRGPWRDADSKPSRGESRGASSKPSRGESRGSASKPDRSPSRDAASKRIGKAKTGMMKAASRQGGRTSRVQKSSGRTKQR